MLIYDKKKKITILGRDVFGIKPLYFSLINEGIIFSSEVQSIKNLNSKSLIYQRVNFLNFFSFSIVPEKKLFLKKFKE